MENDNFIHPVEKFRPELAFEFAHDLIFHRFVAESVLFGGKTSDTRFVISREPMLDVMIRMVCRKSTLCPVESVNRPSSKTWRRILYTSGCAFSISSRQITE
jgi:hypothetical protein